MDHSPFRQTFELGKLITNGFVRFGRKKTVIGHMILGGSACFIVSLIPAGTGRTGKH